MLDNKSLTSKTSYSSSPASAAMLEEKSLSKIVTFLIPSIAAGYNYFIKDHLGNTRLVLTDEQQTDSYPAVTLEDGAIAIESTYYNINTGAIVDYPTSLPSNYANNYGNPPYNFKKLQVPAVRGAE